MLPKLSVLTDAPPIDPISIVQSTSSRGYDGFIPVVQVAMRSRPGSVVTAMVAFETNAEVTGEPLSNAENGTSVN